MDRAAYEADIEAWRRRRLERLTDPEGWLSVVGLGWLEPGENTIGGDPGSRILLPAALSPGRLAAVTLSGDRAFLETGAGTRPVAIGAGEEVPLLSHGTLRLSLLERSGRLGVRVRDSESPARSAFRGIESYPIDPAWRLEARFEAFDPPKTVMVTSALGLAGPETSPGAVVFEAAGSTHSLLAILEPGEKDYWVIFGDATNGRETYGAGRFVYLPPPTAGRTVLDFNKAYNPPCVFTPYSTCPLPPPGNRLAIPIEAGEMAPIES